MERALWHFARIALPPLVAGAHSLLAVSVVVAARAIGPAPLLLHLKLNLLVWSRPKPERVARPNHTVATACWLVASFACELSIAFAALDAAADGDAAGDGLADDALNTGAVAVAHVGTRLDRAISAIEPRSTAALAIHALAVAAAVDPIAAARATRKVAGSSGVFRGTFAGTIRLADTTQATILGALCQLAVFAIKALNTSTLTRRGITRTTWRHVVFEAVVGAVVELAVGTVPAFNTEAFGFVARAYTGALLDCLCGIRVFGFTPHHSAVGVGHHAIGLDNELGGQVPQARSLRTVLSHVSRFTLAIALITDAVARALKPLQRLTRAHPNLAPEPLPSGEAHACTGVEAMSPLIAVE